jgi:hypothetical protein
MARDQAIALGLSSTADAEVDDPMQRQEACLLIAAFLRHVGDLAGTRSWAQRASEVSAGAGSHKDYHMAQVASWLVRSIHRAGPDELLTLDRLARAIEVAGGRGGFDGATDELQLLLRLEPARACRLAFEWIDRQVLNIAGVVAALTAGGAAAGAGGILLSAIYCELYSLIAHGDTSKVALAVLSAFPNEHKREVAVRLMASARVNGLPSHRAEVARSLEGALREEGLGELVLTGGLGPGEDDSARQSTLYRTAAGEVETLEQVAARLGDQEHPEAWNPNPDGNTGFEWWAAIRKAKVRNLAHLDTLVARFPPPDYRKVELFADKAELLLESGDRNAAREFAEQAISVARDGSWHRWFDGAQKRTGYGALKKVDRTAGASRARDQFAKDLAAGKLHNSYLLSDIGETLELMEIDWPADAARAAVNDYLEQVLLGNQHVPPYDALSGSSPAWSTDEALCRFIAHFAAFPVVEVAVSARRVLAQYVAGGGKGLTALLADAREWDPVQLEHILAAVHVGSRSHASSLGELRTWIEGLNASESLGLRSIAKRICDEQRWDWRDITTQPNQPVILLTRSDDNEREIPMLVDGDVTVAWRLYRVLFAPLEEAGLDRQELRSEFERVYRALEKAYVWTDDERMKRWMKMLSARFWLHPRAILGREAAMRVFGRRSLSGQVSPGAEVAYDQLYPIYDPALEVTQPTERPAELRGLDWRIAGGEREAWLDGACAETWDDYPDSVLGLRIVGERTWLIRPEWEWPREERYRGLVAGAPSQATGRRSLNSAYELTYEMYLSGRGQDEQQLIVLNDERQLSGSAYKWAAINPSFARALGWRPSEDAPFQWLDSSSNVMVTSTYWRDGWVWLEPPRFESLGEGWFVSATPAAIEAMRRLAPEASVHLWVERHSHGERPYAGKWHLSKPL